MNAQTIKVYRNELEPGTHICRKAIGRELIAELVLPFDDCSEVRGDWGCWSPVVTIQAVARTLRRLNVLHNHVLIKLHGYFWQQHSPDSIH